MGLCHLIELWLCSSDHPYLVFQQNAGQDLQTSIDSQQLQGQVEREVYNAEAGRVWKGKGQSRLQFMGEHFHVNTSLTSNRHRGAQQSIHPWLDLPQVLKHLTALFLFLDGESACEHTPHCVPEGEKHTHTHLKCSISIRVRVQNYNHEQVWQALFPLFCLCSYCCSVLFKFLDFIFTFNYSLTSFRTVMYIQVLSWLNDFF